MTSSIFRIDSNNLTPSIACFDGNSNAQVLKNHDVGFESNQTRRITINKVVCALLFSLILAFFLCALQPQFAHAVAYSYTSPDGSVFTYEDDSDNIGGIKITAFGHNQTQVVPNEIDGKPVTSIRYHGWSSVSNNAFPILDCKACQSLKTIYLPSCPASKLDVKGCTSLVSIEITPNNSVPNEDVLKTIDASDCGALESIDCSGVKTLESLDVKNCPALKTFDLNNTNISSIDVSTNGSLEYLDLNTNYSITTLDVTHNPKLKHLSIYRKDGDLSPNGLSGLDISKNPELEYLVCAGCHLTTLDVSNNPNLVTLNCVNNELTTLDISHNPKLTELYCDRNSITDYTALKAWAAEPGHSIDIYFEPVTPPVVTKTNLSQCTVAAIANQTYTGAAISPKPVVKYGNTTLKENTDYTLSYKNNINAGTATITITGKGDYIGSKSVTFKITQKNISGCTVTAANQNYTGKALTPAPVVKNGNTILKAGTDYTVSYANNTKVGVATATVTGKGNYTGSKSASFIVMCKEGWVKSGNRWWYRNIDGSYPKSCSKVIGGNTYRFDGSGWMRTGWVKEGSNWYYHASSGAMIKGWLKSGGKWYYLDPVTGIMKTGKQVISNKTYFFNSSGVMQKGWTKYYDTWYYTDSSGAIVKGWKKIGGKWYYFDENGEMINEKYQIGNDTYKLSSSGAMVTGWSKEGNDWYYYKSSGAMAKDIWVGNYWLDSEGTMSLSAWVDNGKYYVNETGKYVPNVKARAEYTPEPGYYRITSILGNVRLDMAGGSVSSGGNAQIYTPNTSNAQIWQFTKLDNGFYRITNAGSNLPLDVYCGKSADGTNVQQYEWNESYAQQWKIYKSDFNNAYVIRNRATGKALDVSSGSTKAGTNVHIWTETANNKAQAWTFTKVSFNPVVTGLEGKTYTFKTGLGSRDNDFAKCLDMTNLSTTNGGNAQIFHFNPTNAQVWKLEKYKNPRDGKDYYIIRNVNSNKVLDVVNGSKTNGANVQQYDLNYTDAQLWTAYRSLYGGYVFINLRSGKALDVASGSFTDHVNVHIWDKNDTKAQSWYLDTQAPYTQTSQTSTSTVVNSKTAPPSGAAKHAMNSDELAEARAIFDAYNSFRASKGLPYAVWSDDCANMAYGSATGCAARKALPHKLGIPVKVQGNYSDILQYSTWKMNAAEAIQRWSKSDGHRKMMQCNTTTVAGVAAYNNNGTWYYAIVYNFVGTNQNGN